MRGSARYWLRSADGPDLWLPERGLLFGRAPECDVVLEDRRASKRQALLRPSVEGLELFALGRNPTRLGGRVVDRYARPAAGEELELPGGTWRIDRGGAPERAPIWQLEVAGGGRYGLRWLPFTVGGGADHLVMEGWPAQALCFIQAGGTLVAELGAALSIGGRSAPAGSLDLPGHGQRYELAGRRLTLLSAARDGAPPAERTLPVRARLTLLSGGGRLTLEFPDQRIGEVELPPPRGRLIAVLLSPPPHYRAGDWLPDEVLIPSIWPAEAQGSAALDQLLHQTRRDLAWAGLDPSLLTRDRRGGGARLSLAPGALIEVR